MPHDLWAAADLPPISLVDRLTLIAIQFDLTFKVAEHGKRLELVPVPENESGAFRRAGTAQRCPVPAPSAARPPSLPWN